MTHQKRGRFTILEGIDRVGKGTLLSTLVAYEQSLGKIVFNLDPYQAANVQNPKVEDLSSYQLVQLSEPSYNQFGKIIREEMIRKQADREPLKGLLKMYRELAGIFIDEMIHQKEKYSLQEFIDANEIFAKIGRVARDETERTYTALETAKAYALDRAILFKNYLLSYLDTGKALLQSRGVASSLVYQLTQAKWNHEQLSLEEILALPGNQFELQHAPDLLLILTVNDVDKAFERSSSRGKDDKSEFEKIEFQKALKKEYESEWLKKIFEAQGTVVKHIDTSGTVEQSKENVLKAYREFWKC